MKEKQNILRNSDLKVSTQIAIFLEDRIQKGEFPEGSVLPSERKLCEEYKVSRVTVRHALEILRNKGIIEKYHGIGNIVRKKTIFETKGVIGVLTFSSKTFTNYILSGIYSYLENTSFKLAIIDTDFDVHKERKAIKKLEKEVRGFLAIPCVSKLNIDLYTELISKKIPVVFIDRYLPEVKISNVSTDNRKGGYIAGKHLISVGRYNLAFLSPPLNTAVKDRLDGFKKVLKEKDIEPKIIKFSGMVPEPGKELIKEIKNELDKIDGIFAANDLLAIQIIQELKKMGIKIPEDISIVGFDDLDFVKYLSPPLTTVRQNLFKMGYQAIELLTKMIEKNEIEYKEIRMEPELVIRATTCNLKEKSMKNEAHSFELQG